MFDRIKSNLFQMPGWRTKRKIVVIESDDWGSIRIPSKEAYNSMVKKGLSLDTTEYDRSDCLENRNDLNQLFEVLLDHRDRHGNHPIFTFNTVMGNPDFPKIRSSNFESYFFQPFFDSYQEYYGENNKSLWFAAMKEGIMKPQFHAREHLNTFLWMKDLKSNLKETRLAFDYNFFAVNTRTSSSFRQDYLGAYYAENEEEFEKVSSILGDGLTLFKKSFGFPSESFIACNYIWPQELEKTLFNLGIKIIQGQRAQVASRFRNPPKIHYHFTGQKNKFGQQYTIRNVFFEPHQNLWKDWDLSVLNEMERSFAWGKPAIISTHRINYVGSITDKVKSFSLTRLDQILSKMLNKWPDIEFVSSDRVFDL